MELIALTGIKRISAYAERIYRFAVAKCHCVTRISEASSELSIKDKERIGYYVLSFFITRKGTYFLFGVKRK